MKKLIAVSLLFPCVIFASEPTKEQTVEFLKEKLNVRFRSGNYSDNYSSFSEVRDCTFKIEKSFGHFKEIGIISRAQVFDARKMDPSTVEFDSNAVRFYSIRREQNVQFEDNLYYEGQCGYGKLISKNTCQDKVKQDVVGLMPNQILSPYEINGPKVAKALKHLIKVCGGKGELF